MYLSKITIRPVGRQQTTRPPRALAATSSCPSSRPAIALNTSFHHEPSISQPPIRSSRRQYSGQQLAVPPPFCRPPGSCNKPPQSVHSPLTVPHRTAQHPRLRASHHVVLEASLPDLGSNPQSARLVCNCHCNCNCSRTSPAATVVVWHLRLLLIVFLLRVLLFWRELVPVSTVLSTPRFPALPQRGS